jgi:non-ribosomal peptide synthetase component F
MFVLQNVPQETLDLPGQGAVKFFVPGEVQSKFDLTLYVRGASEISLCLVYKTDLFDESTAKRLLQHYRAVLENVTASPEQRLSDIILN